MIVRAPAKLNLCLYLGEARDDGLHELTSLFCPLALSDRIVLEPRAEAEVEEPGAARPPGADLVLCPGVEGPNLATAALDALRARGWRRPPLRVEIDKRIPVAAGLGGGSADAAAILRLAHGEVEGLDQAALGLGADVPSQLQPRFALVTGAGERIEPLPPPPAFAVVMIPAARGLATREVFAAADRLGAVRSGAELDEIGARLREAAVEGASPRDYGELLVNDLERAALSLRPEIAEALAALTEVGAARALISGSGPTAFGLFDDLAAADRAAAALPPRFASAIVSSPPRLD